MDLNDNMKDCLISMKTICCILLHEAPDYIELNIDILNEYSLLLKEYYKLRKLKTELWEF